MNRSPRQRPASLPPGARRRSLDAACGNALIWAIGNGLASASLVVYLALELGAAGIAISLILAAPSLLGALRLSAGWLIDLVGDRKRFTVAAHLASALVLLLAPLFCRPGVLSSKFSSLAALVVFWSVYHLLEYLGTIALWSWLGDLAPSRIRGRFIGVRERYLLGGRILGMIAGGLFTYWWREHYAREFLWMGYAIAASVGSLFLAAAVAPLTKMSSVPLLRPEATPRPSCWRPLADRRFRRLLLFGCWFSFFNGVTQTAQNIYPASVLQFHLFWMLLFRGGMRLGQAGASPTVGWLVDRVGNRVVMLASQLLVATGPLFFLAATVEHRWWLAGAWVVWIAYVGLNVGITNLTLKLSPPGENASYLALYFALTGVCYGLTTIAGGALFDHLKVGGWPMSIIPENWTHFQVLFLLGWILRTAGAIWILFLIEPNAWRIWPTWRRSKH